MSNHEKVNTALLAFTENQKSKLKIIANILIPTSEEHQIPSAADDVIFVDILLTAAVEANTTAAALTKLGTLARSQYAEEFDQLSAEKQNLTVRVFREKNPDEFALLLTITCACYYRDDRVMRSLNMETRAPFPLGFTVEQGEWSLLDPVKSRPKMYRKVGK
ncbi:MAG: hypothetical protein ACI92E_000542 [Oceanicoccus sp.]|jgi:hypothetical protein